MSYITSTSVHPISPSLHGTMVTFHPIEMSTLTHLMSPSYSKKLTSSTRFCKLNTSFMRLPTTLFGATLKPATSKYFCCNAHLSGLYQKPLPVFPSSIRFKRGNHAIVSHVVLFQRTRRYRVTTHRS
jgi:hypothetical protein